jgi:mono/diheme cytochrome c family protein
MRLSYLVLAGAALAASVLLRGMHAQAEDPNALDEILRQSANLEQEYRSNPALRQQVETGFRIAPVPLDPARKALALVGLGSYIVTVQGDCNGCHTSPSYAPGGDPFKGEPKQVNVAGYLAGGEHFRPGVVSRNLTPEDGLPAGRTYAEFKQIMRTGVDLDKAHPQYGPLLQVMPWPAYQGMSDRDLLAIYAYLSAIPALAPRN